MSCSRMSTIQSNGFVLEMQHYNKAKVHSCPLHLISIEVEEVDVQLRGANSPPAAVLSTLPLQHLTVGS